MILHVGSHVLEVKLKSDEKIILENTKRVMILLVGSYIFEVKVRNHIREHKTCYDFRCSYSILEVCTYTKVKH